MRTEYCGQLRLSHEGQQVTLCGWVNRRRDLGSLIFIDMRDREGIVQVFFDPDRADALKLASELRNEFCIQVTGTVRARDAKNVNADMALIAILIRKYIDDVWMFRLLCHLLGGFTALRCKEGQASHQ